EGVRGWEWQHLNSRLDESTGDIPAQASAARLWPGPQGLRLVTLADQSLRVLDEQGHVERTVPFPHQNGALWAVPPGPEGLFVLDQVSGRDARLRDATGAVLLNVQAPGDLLRFDACLNPNSKRLAIAWRTEDGHFAGLYDFSGKEQARWPDFHRADVWSV